MAAAGKPTRAVVETLDIFPTICELTGLKPPSGLNGQSLMPILADPSKKGHAAFAYRGSAQTIRTDTHRLIAHRGGELELYDHTTPAGETQNLAKAQPEKADALLKQLRARLPK